MPLKFNNTDITSATFNGTSLTQIYFNGAPIFIAAVEKPEIILPISLTATSAAWTVKNKDPLQTVTLYSRIVRISDGFEFPLQNSPIISSIPPNGTTNFSQGGLEELTNYIIVAYAGVGLTFSPSDSYNFQTPEKPLTTLPEIEVLSKAWNSIQWKVINKDSLAATINTWLTDSVTGNIVHTHTEASVAGTGSAPNNFTATIATGLSSEREYVIRATAEASPSKKLSLTAIKFEQTSVRPITSAPSIIDRTSGHNFIQFRVVNNDDYDVVMVVWVENVSTGAQVYSNTFNNLLNNVLITLSSPTYVINELTTYRVRAYAVSNSPDNKAQSSTVVADISTSEQPKVATPTVNSPSLISYNGATFSVRNNDAASVYLKAEVLNMSNVVVWSRNYDTTTTSSNSLRQFSATGLLPLTTYKARARAIDTIVPPLKKESDWGVSGNFSTPNFPPAATPSITFISKTSNSVTFRVQNNDAGAGKVYYRIGTTGSYTSVDLNGSTQSTNRTISGLTANTNYIIYAYTDNVFERSASASTSYAFTTNRRLATPQINEVSKTTSSITWNVTNKDTQFQVDIGSNVNSTSSWPYYRANVGVNATTSPNFTISSLSQNTSYVVYAQAFDQTGNYQESIITSRTITTDPLYPNLPLVSISSSIPGSISWTVTSQQANTTLIHTVMKNSSGADIGPWKYASNVQSSSFSQSVSSGTQYYILARVSASGTTDQESYTRNPSNTSQFNTVPFPPQPSITSLTRQNPTLATWTAVRNNPTSWWSSFDYQWMKDQYANTDQNWSVYATSTYNGGKVNGTTFTGHSATGLVAGRYKIRLRTNYNGQSSTWLVVVVN